MHTEDRKHITWLSSLRLASQPDQGVGRTFREREDAANTHPVDLLEMSRPQRRLVGARPLKACMVTYSFYENDGRVKRYAETLAHEGWQVDVISLRNVGQSRFEAINGVDVHRIQERVRDEKNKWSYCLRLLRFFVHSAMFLSRQHLKQPYDLIHVHSIPDFEIFAAVLPKLLGSKLILDIHDIVPELYVSKFGSSRDGLLFKALLKIERWACAFADHVIASNHIWEERLLSRSVSEERCTTLLNYPDPAIFRARSRKAAHDKVVLIYPGTLNWHQGVDLAIEAFALIAAEHLGAEFHIYGQGGELERLRDLVTAKKLGHRISFHAPVPIEKVAELMTNADLGIIPKRNDPFGGEAFSTKSLEFMSVGVPVVMSKTRIDSHYFNESVVKFFEPGNVESLAFAMREMIRDHGLRNKLSVNASQLAQEFSWSRKRQEYLELIDRLLN
jgi:glycosyltransferase involved in cell wall biosynthesis